MNTTNLPSRVLGVWAHPDDEAYLSAGLMARVADAGGHVTVVTASYGEAGFGDDDPRPEDQRAELRRKEMAQAMAAAGVEDVRFLGFPDGGVADIPEAIAVRRVAEVIREVEPELVITFGPDGVTGHDDHVAACRFTTAAWQMTKLGELLYAANTVSWLDEFRQLHNDLGVWMTEEPEATPDHDLTLDILLNPVEIERKRRVLAGHHSQTAGIAAAMGESTYRRWYSQEAFRRPTTADLAQLSGSARPRRTELVS